MIGFAKGHMIEKMGKRSTCTTGKHIQVLKIKQDAIQSLKIYANTVDGTLNANSAYI